MDIRIGIVQSMKEIDVELPVDADREAIMKDVEAVSGYRPVASPTSNSARRRAIVSSDSAPPKTS
jgi:hypothetical protein